MLLLGVGAATISPAAGAAPRPELSLSVPSTVTSGARVLVTGKVASAPDGAHAVLQWQHGKKWASLGRAGVANGRFKIFVLVPAGQSALRVRAIVIARGGRLAVSAIRKLTVRAPATIASRGAQPTSTPATSPGPGSPEPASLGPIAVTAPAVDVAVGSVVGIPAPAPLTSLSEIDGSVLGAGPGVAAFVAGGGIAVSASATAMTGSMTLTLTGTACTASECGRRFVIQLPLAVKPIAASAGPVGTFTQPSPDRIAEAVDNELRDEVLVMLGTSEQPGTPEQAGAAAGAVDGVVAGGLSEEGIYQVRWSTPQDLAARIAELEGQPDVTSVSPSMVGLAATQTAYAPTVAPAYDQPYWTWRYDQVHASQAWSQTTGSDVTVGVVDVGDAFAGSPDLNVSKTLDPIAIPGAHATNVAGLACGKADGAGMVGLAWGCPIVTTYAEATVVMKDGQPVLDGDGQPRTSIPDASVMAAMQRVTKAPGVRVVNVSMGAASGCATAADRDAIEQWIAHGRAFFRRILQGAGSNVLWTFSAGNNCMSGPSSPWAASSDLSNVIDVAATNADRTLASFSNYDVAVAAPGGVEPAQPAIDLQASCDGEDVLDEGRCGLLSSTVAPCPLGYCPERGEMAGTSMAAPVVAGIAALVTAKHPSFSAAQIAACITSTAGTGGVMSTKPPDGQPGGAFADPPLTYAGGPIPVVNAAAAVECQPEGTSVAYTSPGRISDISCAGAGHCVILESRFDGTYGVSQGSGWSPAKLPEIVDPLRAPHSDTSYGYLRCYEDGSFCVALGNYYELDAHGNPSLIPVVAVEEDGAWSTFKAPGPGPRAISSSAPAFQRWRARASCAGRSFCAVVAQYETDGSAALVLSDGTWSAEWFPEEPESIIGPEVKDITCPAIGRCTAVGAGNGFQYGGAIWQYSLGTWTAESAPATEEAAGRHYSVTNQISCSSSTDCTSIGLSEGAFNFFWGEVFTEADGHWSVEDVPLPEGSTYGAAVTMSCYGREECTFVVGANFDGNGSPNLHPYILKQTPSGLSSLDPVDLPPDATSPVLDVGPLSCESSDSCRALARYTVSESEAPVGLLKTGGGTPKVVKAPVIDGEEFSINYGDPYSPGAMSCPSSQVCGLIGGLASKSVVVMLEE